MSYQEYRDLLLETARNAIRHGLNYGSSPKIRCEDFPEALREPRASFVTLEINGQLRGCIGSLEARRPLVEDIAGNAYSAAFSDPRFSPLTESEFPRLEIHVSILGPAEPMLFTSEQDLLRQIRPGKDGLILEDQGKRGTFLPSVWESLPTAQMFLDHLRIKAGLPSDYWSDTLRVYRYTTEVVE